MDFRATVGWGVGGLLRRRLSSRPRRTGTVPYLVSEPVGTLVNPTYRWSDPRAGFGYYAAERNDRNWNTLRTAGVIGTFRVPRPGAAAARPVISEAQLSCGAFDPAVVQRREVPQRMGGCVPYARGRLRPAGRSVRHIARGRNSPPTCARHGSPIQCNSTRHNLPARISKTAALP